MPTIQISQYKRPGIFINEYDRSIITSPVTQGINTLVVGFSKTGPFNNPVLLTNTTDLTNIFGNIDRTLERKGSFFHRTVTQMLNSSPVYAMNLLATDDTLDQLQYQSFSAATDKSNGPLSQNSYRKFFNTTGFWTRDTNAFLNVTSTDSDYNNVVFSLTNFSSTPVSIFVIKSQKTGFDVTLTTWYGSVDQVPPYLNPNDYASDYLVDVVIVAGDWSNYQSLSVDPRWSKYFTSTGLIKSQIYNFTSDRNVNLLEYYEGLSLIPYFRDLSGNNIFIESIINLDTDSSGVFCAFNDDIVETDYPTGMLDLIGNNIVNTQQKSINFLSYQADIVQQLPYGDVILDSPGNVWAIINPSYVSEFRGGTSTYTRTANYSEGYISGVSATASLSSNTINFNLSLNEPYAVVNGLGITIDTTTASYTVATASYPATGATYTSTLVLHTNGEFGLINGTLTNVNPIVGTSDLVLGYSTVYLDNTGTFGNFTYNNVYVNANGYNELVLGSDYTVSITGSDVVISFLDTAAVPSVSNYEQYRKIKYFNNIVSKINSPNRFEMTTIVSASTQQKLSMDGVYISNIKTSSLVDKSFQLSGLGGYSDISVNGNLVFYTVDNEFIVGTNGMTTTDFVGTTSSGVVAKHSQFYLDYYNGDINDTDYFYTNYVDPLDIANGGFNTQFVILNGSYYVILQTQTGSPANAWPNGTAQSGDEMIFPTAVLNTGIITIEDYTNVATLFGGTGNGSDGMYAFLLSTTVVSEYLTDVETIYNVNLQHFLKMYIDVNNNMTVSFVDQVGDPLPLDLGPDLGGSTFFDELEYAQNQFDVFSDLLNYKESVDVQYPSGYQSSPNQVLVDATRYIDIVIGDFLEASVDTSTLQSGEVPRRLTRILTKQFYPSDTTKVILTCDSAIAITNLGSTASPQWQTTRWKEIEDYTTTYQSIVLNGFQVRQASMPDGTEARQNQILNLVAAGTPLNNALINKDAIDFRYVIDSFGLGLIANSKQQLVDICGGRLDCLGFINMPSMKQFAASNNPSFLTNDVLDTALIAAGGNISLNPSFLYSFGQGSGVSAVGYFCPYLTIDDNGRPLDLPPAMFVATTYMRKQNSNISSIVPWTVAAGVTNGKVTGFEDVETDFTDQDIINLNSAQMNMIVYKRNRGFIIDTENTAQTEYTSALSYIHVREVLIELERQLTDMLLDFQWAFNTPDVRAEIKLRADVICEQFVNKNGLYNYFNKCDDENNPPQIIDAQIGVLDTYVEPIKAMGIIVNNITILRTGAIQSGGFITS